MKGRSFEDKACEFLKNKGLAIVSRNYRCRFGEIDIIAREKSCIAFIEVKGRRDSGMVTGLEAVDKHKQQKIRKTALMYSQNYPDSLYRFDVVEVIEGKGWWQYNWVKNAFDMNT